MSSVLVPNAGTCSVICEDGRKFATVILIRCSTVFFNGTLSVLPVDLLSVALIHSALA